MQTFSIPDAAMPTLSKLGSPIIPGNLDVNTIVSEWFASFSTYASGGDVEGLLSIIVDSSFASNIFNSKGNDAPSNASDIPVYWRDLLALTWDFRTFEGVPRIKDFLSSQLCPAQISKSQLYRGVHPVLQTPFTLRGSSFFSRSKPPSVFALELPDLSLPLSLARNYSGRRIVYL